MLSLVQHLSSNDFRTLYKTHAVLKSQGLPILYEGKLKPRIYQLCGQHTAALCPGVTEGTNILCSLPLTHQSTPTPAQFMAGSRALILLYMIHLKNQQQVCRSGKFGLTLPAEPGLRVFQYPERS